MIDGIKALLLNEPDIVVVGESTDPVNSIERILHAAPDILITDINMPVMDGIQLTRKLRAVMPELKVLGLSMHGDRSVISDMLQAGVNGYVLKNTGKEELMEALRRIAVGGMFFSEDVTKEMMKTISASSEMRDKVKLTTREVEIVKLISEELNNAQISERLFISERTVETHRKNIFRKTGTKSVAGLIKYAIEHKII